VQAGNFGFDYRIVDRSELADTLPGLGPAVSVASWTPYDGLPTRSVCSMRYARALPKTAYATSRTALCPRQGGTGRPSHPARHAPVPRRADRSADGMLLTRGYRYCEALAPASAFGWYICPQLSFSLVWDGVEIAWT
jgi:hypothetical protein